MPKTKPTKRTVQRAKDRAKQKDEAATPQLPQLPPWHVPYMVAERVWTHLPAYFQALQSLHEEQVKTNALLTEIRDSLKE